jgi:L-rhamnose isomerase
MKDSNIIKSYELAKELYSEIGVNTEKAIECLKNTQISMHCWQGDDNNGFENFGRGMSGGILATGNYPGRATTPNELMADIKMAMSLIPGKQKLNLHAWYLDNKGKAVDRNQIQTENFDIWVDFANSLDIALDFNPTYYAHEKSESGFTLSSRDKSIRDFWIEHGKRSRKIGEYFGKKTGKTCITNIWIPDGYKDNPIDEVTPRELLKESLDEILKEKIDKTLNKDAVESKLFGIGSESCVIGSHEFYMGYAMQNRDVLLTLDAGHFHPTESIAKKIPTLLLYIDELLLHVSRPVRWDSDHVVTLDDELQNIMHAIIRSDAINRVNIALDFFDASINRIAAWVVGVRNTQKALLKAVLEPVNKLKEIERANDYTSRLALTEEYKTYPFGAVYDYFCLMSDVPVMDSWIEHMKLYEEQILLQRNKLC